MFKNNLPHPQKKSPTNVQTKCNNDYQTADDATMNVISWNHDFLSQNPF